MDKLLLVLVGVAVGGLLSAALALPWLSPLPDYVVNAWTNMCTATLAVGGAFLLWRHQIREREKVLTRTLVLVFESFMDELNYVRISVDFDHVKALMEKVTGAFDPEDVPDFMERTAVPGLRSALGTARIVQDHFRGLDDALAALSPTKIKACLDIYEQIAEMAESLPSIIEKTEPLFAAGNIEAAATYRHEFDLCVSKIAHFLNVLDSGKREDSYYRERLADNQLIQTFAESRMPTQLPMPPLGGP